MFSLFKTLIAFSVLLTSAQAAYGTIQSQPINQQQLNHSHSEDKSDMRGTDKSPLVIKVIPDQKTEYDGPSEERRRQEQTETIFWNRAQIGVGVIQFFVLVVQAFVFGTQARRLRETVEQMKTSEERQLRAYICFLEGHVELHANEGYYDVNFSLNNSGQTPAYDVQTWRGSCIIGLPEPASAFQAPDSWGGRGIVGPGASMGAVGTLRTKFTPQDLISIKEKKKTICVWGEVIYRDAFGKSRFTRFRHILGSETGRGWLLRPAEQGNESN